ncbi:hypothetical protein HELRODRAFT_165073 [Helobdella robusta]|uniref:Uncharacterized protein n=1 Tax=Helobdella robusta TaxID=6412 RepID=T1EW92_HELRO|nr:hypothetical protein HELRODRAFT_165073 [Helobdella robusta]ESN92935.1 hypothetical protein HELRODRAFT_165073 [Helobdella robusta]
MYRLSRDDLKIICGVAEGIRIFNALVKGMKTTKLLLFVSPKNFSDHESKVLLRRWMSSDIVAPDSPNNVTSSTVSNGSFSNLAHNIDNMYLSQHFQNNQTHKKRYSKKQPQNQHIEENQSNEPEKETLKKVKNSTNYDENDNNVKTDATKAFLPVLRCGDKRPSQWQLLIVAPKKSKQLEELMVDGWEVTRSDRRRNCYSMQSSSTKLNE